MKYPITDVVQAIHETKGMITIAAQRLGCSHNTLKSYRLRFPQVDAAFKEERESFLDVAELALYKQVQAGEAWAVCFTLKTLGKGRGFIERQELEHSGKLEVTSDGDDYERIAGRLARILTQRDEPGSDSGKAPQGAHANGSTPA